MIFNGKGFVLSDYIAKELKKMFDLTIYEVYEKLQNKEMLLEFETKHEYLTAGNPNIKLALYPRSTIVHIKYGSVSSQFESPYEALTPIENLTNYYRKLSEQFERLKMKKYIDIGKVSTYVDKGFTVYFSSIEDEIEEEQVIATSSFSIKEIIEYKFYVYG